HIDGLYLSQLPDYVALMCLEPGSGKVRTRFSDLSVVSDKLRDAGLSEAAEQLEIRYVGKDGREKSHKLLSTAQEFPSLVIGSRAYLAFSENSDLRFISLRQTAQIASTLMEELDSCVVLDHRWCAGDCIVFNNRRLAHSRSRDSDADRVLYRFWLN